MLYYLDIKPNMWLIIKNKAYLRYGELKDIVEGLFEKHDNSHLDEEVRQTTTGVTLQDTDSFVPAAIEFLNNSVWAFLLMFCALLALGVCLLLCTSACCTKFASCGILMIFWTWTCLDMYS